MKEKVGVYVCECGPNIGDKVDVPRILEELSSLSEFKDCELVVKNHKLLCSADGKVFLEKEIRDEGLTRLVVAACSPRDHDSTFMGVCKKAGLNPYLYRIVNIREQCAWVIPDKDKATDKTISYIQGAMNRVMYQSALQEKQLETCPDVLVVGGGIAGIETALGLASENRTVFLVERNADLGGFAGRLRLLQPGQKKSYDWIAQKAEAVKKHPGIKVFTRAKLSKAIGFFGNFEITIEDEAGDHDLLAGAIVLATGFKLAQPRRFEGIEYQPGDNVFTTIEIENMDRKVRLRNGEKPKSVALVHCVGRNELGYCSRNCCTHLIKISGYFRQEGIPVTHLVQDWCLPSKDDQQMLKYLTGVDVKRVDDVRVSGTKLTWTGRDGREQTLEPDMVVLASGMEPAGGTNELVELLKLEMDETGFVKEGHLKINPVGTSVDGVFAVGGIHGPAGIAESMVQARAAAGKILTKLIPGVKITPEVKVSEVLEAYCTGCRTCLEVCAYGAIEFDTERNISVVNEAICRGCGNCVGSCPSGAIRSRHFTNPQLYQEMLAALE